MVIFIIIFIFVMHYNMTLCVIVFGCWKFIEKYKHIIFGRMISCLFLWFIFKTVNIWIDRLIDRQKNSFKVICKMINELRTEKSVKPDLLKHASLNYWEVFPIIDASRSSIESVREYNDGGTIIFNYKIFKF